MKVTVKIEGTRREYDAYQRNKETPYTVVEVEDVVFTDALTANFLRAVANEIDPPKASVDRSVLR